MLSISRRSLHAIALGAALGLAAWPLAAQRRGLREVYERGTAGGALSLAVPVGEMGEFVDFAGGANLFVAPSLGRGSPLALRLEGEFLAHQLSSELYGSSASFVTSLRVGPQLALGGDGARLYGALLGGPSYFATTRTVIAATCRCGYYEEYRDSYTLSGDVAWGWELGGGMQLRVGGRHSPVFLDLGARLVRHEDVRYLARGVASDGTPMWIAVQGPAEFVVYRIGISVGYR